jgi:hypothetical protein
MPVKSQSELNALLPLLFHTQNILYQRDLSINTSICHYQSNLMAGVSIKKVFPKLKLETPLKYIFSVYYLPPRITIKA